LFIVTVTIGSSATVNSLQRSPRLNGLKELEAVFEGIITNVHLNVAVDMAVTIYIPGASFSLLHWSCDDQHPKKHFQGVYRLPRTIINGERTLR